MAKEYFNGRSLVIATMHEKERAIAPILETELGVKIVVPKDFDTDQFGTFSGEIERIVDPLEAARRKCIAAASQNNCSLAIASEGSFGPHPSLVFMHCDDEILLLLDLENELEFKVRELTTETNFNGRLMKSWAEAKSFASAALFPLHGLIIRRAKDDIHGIIKGVHDWGELEKIVKALLNETGEVFIETDMRAMHNPTRMKVIESATRKLMACVKNNCPQCDVPGFHIARAVPGLPCQQCGAPTRSTFSHIYRCQKCSFYEERKFPNGKQNESPIYCDWCNP